jgi:cell division protein ZapA
MSSNAIKVKILDKEYLVACPADEEAALQASAKHLGNKMTEIRRSGKVVGIDRIAVMAGLNIAHEALESGIGDAGTARSAGSRIKKMNTKIDKVLARYRQSEMH